jgi:hypothetical protein
VTRRNGTAAVERDESDREDASSRAGWSNERIVSARDCGRRSSSDYRVLTAATAVLFVGFSFLFVRAVGDRWFNGNWTTDDALQQTYPFSKVLDPLLFKNDLVTTLMEGYLTPLHYGVSALFTRIIGDPIQAGHAVHVVQLLLSLLFVMGAVRVLAGTPACMVAGFWLLHTRHIMQRLTGGLPRGWALPVMAAVLFYWVKGAHRWVLVALVIGCLLHPPATFLVGIGYGLGVLYEALRDRTREGRAPLLQLLFVSPLLAGLALWVVRMPGEIGTMVSFSEASQMPEFHDKGRFPFLPLLPRTVELSAFAFQAFFTRWYRPFPYMKTVIFPFLLIGVLSLTLVKRPRREEGVSGARRYFPLEGIFFLVGILATYELSRIFAFKLYVPNRHLQIPMALFFIAFLTSAVWRYASSFGNFPSRGGAALMVLVGVIFLSSGSGLQGSMNFNVHTGRAGRAFKWLEKNSERNALIAGEPTLVDHTQLFARRSVYVSTETSHPFYTTYAMEMKRRLEIVLRAHYTASLVELYTLTKREGISYFVFDRQKFYPITLTSERYFKPLDMIIPTVLSSQEGRPLYYSLPRKVNIEVVPYMVFRDDRAVVVDIDKLGSFLLSQGLIPALIQPSLSSSTGESVKAKWSW